MEKDLSKFSTALIPTLVKEMGKSSLSKVSSGQLARLFELALTAVVSAFLSIRYDNRWGGELAVARGPWHYCDTPAADLKPAWGIHN